MLTGNGSMCSFWDFDGRRIWNATITTGSQIFWERILDMVAGQTLSRLTEAELEEERGWTIAPAQ